MVPYVMGAVVAVTVMRGCCLCKYVEMLRGCEGARVRGCEGARVRGCEGDGNAVVVAVSLGHEYVGGTRGSCIMSSVVHVLGMSVVLGMRGVGGIGEMCICLARSGVGGEGVSG